MSAWGCGRAGSGCCLVFGGVQGISGCMTEGCCGLFKEMGIVQMSSLGKLEKVLWNDGFQNLLAPRRVSPPQQNNFESPTSSI